MKEKVAVVTGASSGIGRATSLLFAEQGARVVAVGRSGHELEMLVKDSEIFEGSIEAHTADVTRPADADRAIEFAASQYGGIDVLVNAAGILKNGTIENTTLEDWDTIMNINLRAMFYMMQKCVPYLEHRGGNVVNVSSVNGPRSFPNVLAYCVSKAGVDQLTRCAALELATKGVRVNAVNPGVVRTNIHKRGGMDEEKYESFLEHSKTTHPLGRVGEPAEIAELIAFLASEKAGWITGATYEIDGGRGQTCAR